MQTTNSSSVKNSEQGINVIDLLMYFAFRWKWFLLSVLICGGIAWLLYARAMAFVCPCSVGLFPVGNCYY